MLAVLLLGGALLVGLAIELGRQGAAWREAAFAADAGAEAGAAAIDPLAAYGGSIRLDPEAAKEAGRAAALAARPRPGREATADADESRVCVTVRQPMPAGLVSSLASDRVIAVSACAVPRRG
jgi:general stress protein YciG